MCCSTTARWPCRCRTAEDSPIASQTTSTAQRAGWIWDIGLPTRRGIGHVYSSAHISDDQAEATCAPIAQTGGAADMPPPRKLSFQPGYREEFWHRNCVAIGLSAGFIEPLEASALALVEMSAAMVATTCRPRARDGHRGARFNEAFTYRWERVIDFLKLHYVLSRRTRFSAYWRDNRRAETSRAAGELLACGATARRRARLQPHRGSLPVGQLAVRAVRDGLHARAHAASRRGQRRMPRAGRRLFPRSAELTRRMLARCRRTAN
jgi:tryptophan halogenase